MTTPATGTLTSLAPMLAIDRIIRILDRNGRKCPHPGGWYEMFMTRTYGHEQLAWPKDPGYEAALTAIAYINLRPKRTRQCKRVEKSLGRIFRSGPVKFEPVPQPPIEEDDYEGRIQKIMDEHAARIEALK